MIRLNFLALKGNYEDSWKMNGHSLSPYTHCHCWSLLLFTVTSFSTWRDKASELSFSYALYLNVTLINILRCQTDICITLKLSWFKWTFKKKRHNVIFLNSFSLLAVVFSQEVKLIYNRHRGNTKISYIPIHSSKCPLKKSINLSV